MPLCVLIIAGLPTFGGNATLRWLFLAGVAICGLQSIFVTLTLRDPSKFDRRWVNAFAVWAALTTYVGVWYIGIFSVSPVAVVVGIHFFGRSSSKAGAFVIYILAAGMQAALAVLVLADVVTDPGIFRADHVDLHMRVMIQVLVQAVFFIAFVLSRSTRASSLRAIEDLQKAMRQVRQREAQFQEVRKELDAALNVVGAGRYTDNEIGSYALGAVIGRGAMAEVYEGVHKASGDRAAVKLLHPDVLAHDGAAERFLREAKAAGALDSPHAVRVLEASGPDAKTPYIAMELLAGHDLAHWLRKRRRLKVVDVVELVGQVAGVIDLARKQQIVHRDLKPQNLFRHEPGDGTRMWKILDFGMSTLGEHRGTLTGGAAVGTPAYMAPEQARGKHVDHRADLYSLSAIAYRCLTGRAPFTGADVPATLYSVVYDMAPQPSLLAADIPPQLDDVLAIGLAKKRANRFESGAELVAAFARAAEGETDDWLQRRAEALLLELPWGTRT
jgi:serine/threonine-protein kinase